VEDDTSIPSTSTVKKMKNTIDLTSISVMDVINDIRSISLFGSGAVAAVE